MKNSAKLSWVLLFSIFCTSLLAQPTISSFSPGTGPVGTLVTINGTNMNNPTAVNIAGSPAIVISNTGTQLVAMVMPGAVTGNVVITTAAGTTGAALFTVSNNTCNISTQQQGNKLVGTGNISSAQQGYAVAISADGNTAIVGGPTNNSNIGAAWIYTRSAGIWIQQGNKLVASDYTGASQQGYSVSINADGNTVVVGGPFDNNNIGAVWIYTRTAGVWTQQGSKLIGTGAIYGAEQGIAVSISADGNTIIEGGSADNAFIEGGNGAVWVFTRSAGNWAQQGNKLVGTGNSGYAHQGCSVSLSADGNTFIEGGYGDGGYEVDCFDFSTMGAAWIFTRSGNAWAQQGNKLVGTGYTLGSIMVCPYTTKPDQGFSVAISADGNTALVGGPNNNGGIGAVWAYSRNGNNWSQQGSPLVGSGISGLGTSVAISADGNTAIAGGPNDNTGQGAFWAFHRIGNNWSPQAKILGTGNIGAANQGHAVAISADGATIISGGNLDNGNQGAAWIFSAICTAAPSITSFSPASGPIGTLVTITGTNLDNPNALNIGGVPAIAISNTGTQLVAMVMPDAVTGNVVITTSGGTSALAQFAVSNNSCNISLQQQGNKLVGTGNSGAAGQGNSVAVSADGNTAVVGGTTDNNNQGAVWIYTRTGNTWSQQGNKIVGAGGISSVALSADGNTVIMGSNNTVLVFTRSGNAWSQQGVGLLPSDNVGGGFGRAVGLSADGNTAVIGSENDSYLGIWGATGAVWVFTRTGNTWSQQGNKLVGTTISYAFQGHSVAISADGNTIIEGGIIDGGTIIDTPPATGAAWIFTRTAGVWSQQGNKLVGTALTVPGYPGTTYAAFQGYSVGLSADGNTAIVGGIGNGNAPHADGAAWIYTRAGNTWTQQGAPLQGTGVIGNVAVMGYSVSLTADGNTAIIGGPYDNSSQGALWSFKRTGNTWSQQGKIIGTGNIGAANQGQSVAISADGTTVISGGNSDNSNQGAAWVFATTCVPAPAPTITAFSPANGPVGTLVTITGNNLGNPTAFTIGGVSAIVISNTGTQLVGMVMPGTTTGNVSLITSSGTASSTDMYTVSASCIPSVQQGNKLVAAYVGTYEVEGASVALSADGNTAIVGGIGDNNFLGTAWIYVRSSGGLWIQQGPKLVGTGNLGPNQQGQSVAISADGNTVAVGGPRDNDQQGAIWVFTRIGNTWTQQGPKLVGTNYIGSVVMMGSSLAMSGDGNSIIAGSPDDNSGQGAVWFFKRNNGVWAQQGNKVTVTDNAGNAFIGSSVAMSADGTTAIIGGQGDNSNQGAIWVFTNSVGGWTQQGNKLTVTDNSGPAAVGYSTAISADGNTAITGGIYDNGGIGSTWVFTRSAGIWTQQGNKITGTGNIGLAREGSSVSISADGNTAIVGAENDNSNVGAIWIYTRSGNTWTQQGNKLVGTGWVGNYVNQGAKAALSADGSTLMEGGPGDNSIPSFGQQGSVWVFSCNASYDGNGGYVNSGSGGGVESKDLGDAIAQRVYNRAINSQNGKVDYNKLSIVGAANQTARPTTFGVGVSSVTLASIMPDITKIGFVAYNSTPTDIVTLTNATEVIATDFTVNQQPKAVAFATKTLGALYDHTKPICDRLKGASLLDVQNITVGGYNFVQYTMKDENGITEYATSFSVGTKAGRSDFSIQSTWLSKDYVSDDVMYNFQLWAATPQLVNAMITDVLTKVQTMAAVTPLVTTNIPATYVMSGNRTGTNLDMVITNTAAGATGYFTLEDKASESSTGTTATRQIPFTVNANGKSTVSIPMNDLYESTITMYVNGVMKDVVYMSDGTWSVDYNKVTTTVNSFTISNDANRVYDPSEYAVLRNASVKGNSSDYVSVFKLLRGGAAETDLSAYKGLKLTAAGGYTLRVTLVKNSIVNWNDQYYTEIKLDDAQKDYYISMDKFASTASTNKITANDVTTVVFAIEVGTGRSAAINTTLSNISFTKVDQSYINSLDSKEIQLYPNPATAKNFSCSFYSNQAQQLTLHVTDVMGRTVATQQVSAIKGLNVVPVALKSGTNGMHIVSLDGADVKYNSKKVLIE